MARQPPSTEIEAQRQYYRQTADQYNQLHVHSMDEHYFALAFLASIVDYLNVRSVLDLGSGTGRALHFIKGRTPSVHVIGIEPVKELRDVGHANGLSPAELIDGDATNLQFKDGEFDLVCEFGMLHHVRNPDVVVAEMLRVAQKAVFISDSNRFGMGTFPVRLLKRLLSGLGLWGLADFIKTRGKGYTISKEDGLAYSYSVFDNYNQINRACKSVHVLNTSPGGINPYTSAGHVALLGMK